MARRRIADHFLVGDTKSRMLSIRPYAKKNICREVKGAAREVASDELSFRPSVYGVIIKNNAVLLVPQWGDGYDFPGGGVELGETMDEALEREVREETGFLVKRDRVLACESDFFITPFSNKSVHSILVFYACTVVGGEISDRGFDAREKEYARKAEWVGLNEIEKIRFYNPVDSVALIREAVACISYDS